MTGREKRWLGAGVLIGLVIASLMFVARQGKERSQPVPVVENTNPAPAGPAGPAEAGAYNVQLTGEEQKSIGVETVEVKRQSIQKEIVAPGRVSEPETGIGVISARISGRVDK